MSWMQRFFLFQCACTFTLVPLLLVDHQLAWKVFFFGAENPERLTSLVYAAALCGEGCLQFAVALYPRDFLKAGLVFMLPYKICATVFLSYSSYYEHLDSVPSDTGLRIALVSLILR